HAREGNQHSRRRDVHGPSHGAVFFWRALRRRGPDALRLRELQLRPRQRRQVPERGREARARPGQMVQQRRDRRRGQDRNRDDDLRAQYLQVLRVLSADARSSGTQAESDRTDQAKREIAVSVHARNGLGSGAVASNTPVTIPGNVSAHFPWIQTRLALERTLLAWVRTAAGMITFGFAIFHFFEALNASPGVRPPWRPSASKVLGVSLVGMGTLALIFALVQYLLLIRYLGGESFMKTAGIPRFRPGLI